MLQNKAAEFFFSIFFPWIITKFTHESVIRLLPRSVESESCKLEIGITITAKQAAKPLASPHDGAPAKLGASQGIRSFRELGFLQ